MVATHHHERVLHGAWGQGRAPGPVIVECLDDDFLPALLTELGRGEPATVVSSRRPAAGKQKKDRGAAPLRLFQPVHRVFNVALVEAHCENFGEPRLNPARIESAGMVVRRVVTSENGRRVEQAWLSADHKRGKWADLLGKVQQERDPDPEHRRALRFTGDAEVDAELSRVALEPAENFVTLFPAEPALVAKLERTLLFGVVPVTSSARSSETPAKDEPDPTQWAAHLCRFLRQSNSDAAISFPNQTITPDAINVTLALPDTDAAPVVITAAENRGAVRFVMLLRQLVQEFRLVRPPTPKAADEVIGILNELKLEFASDDPVAAGGYLRQAGAVLFGDDAGADFFSNGKLPGSIAAPLAWPAFSDTYADRLRDALMRLADIVRTTTVAPAGSAGRFDESGARYFVQAFIRVTCGDACPPRLVWSPPSEEFEIAEWFAPGPVAPPVIALPDPFDKDFLNSAKPGVTFAVPASLANFLNQDPKKILKGEAGKGGGFSIGFLCGFNIPIITICAFIVLNIILSLLNLIFQWIPFVKICIPLPLPKQK